MWRLIKDERASAAAEIAIALPLLLVLIFGTVDVARYLMTVDKIHRVAAASGDLLARAQTLHQSDVDDVLNAVAQMAQPLDIMASGGVIVTGVANVSADGGQRVRWQEKTPATFAIPSKVGAVNGAPSLPPSLVLQDGDSLVFGEAFYTFQPFVFSKGFFGIGNPTIQLYAEMAFRPRLGSLLSILP